MMGIIRAFQRYYVERSRAIFAPQVEKREFMFMDFDDNVRRYISFESLEELRGYLIRMVPKHAYYSVGLYDNPSSRSRNTEGAELLFDIDSTDLGCELCDRDDLYVCRSCGYESGREFDICPRCGGSRVTKLDWLNEHCIEAALEEVKKLLDILLGDFSVNERDLLVSYTGNRGFHVRVLAEGFIKLGKRERMEIVDYVMARGFSPEKIVRKTEEGYIIPDPSEEGWRGRFSRTLLSLFPDRVFKRGEELLAKISQRELREIADEMVRRYSAEIDEAVTFDTKRLTRIPNSLHGKTGLRAMTLSLAELENFNPFINAVGLGEDQMTVRIEHKVPKFRLLDQDYGPFNPGEVVELPAYAAAFVVLKGRGSIG